MRQVRRNDSGFRDPVGEFSIGTVVVKKGIKSLRLHVHEAGEISPLWLPSGGSRVNVANVTRTIRQDLRDDGQIAERRL